MKESAAIAALRRDIDRMDDAIHDLLLARAERVERIGAAKTNGAAIRPAREARILRRLAARHHGPLPLAALLEVWRTVFSAKARMQTSFCVHATDSTDDLARAACGTTPLNRHSSADGVLDALQADAAALGILPLPACWWQRLARDLAADPTGPQVVACLPFLCETPRAVMLARAPYEPSGSDTSLLAVNAPSAGEAEKILGNAGLTITRRPGAEEAKKTKQTTAHLFFIDGHLAADDSRLAGVGVLLGGYPNPLSGDAISGDVREAASPSTPLPRPAVFSIPSYVPGIPAGGDGSVMRLASNESPLGASPAAMEAVRQSSAAASLYPADGAPGLRRALAAHHDLDPDRIICGAGSDQLLGMIARAWLAPGDEAIHCRHSFLFYPIAILAAGGRPVAVPEKNFRADTDAILAAVTPRTRIVFLANPDNPTGSCLAPSDVARLHAGLDPGVLLVVDAAYAEYAEHTDAPGASGYESGLALAKTAGNVVITRTFSKIYGLAGMRAGWCYGSAGVVDALNRLRDPFNLSVAAEAAAVAALKDADFVRRAGKHNALWRPRLEETLAVLGLSVLKGAANFVTVGFPQSAGRRADEAHEFLRRRGILVRHLTAYGLPDHLRITVGPEEAVHGVGDALTAFMKGTG